MQLVNLFFQPPLGTAPIYVLPYDTFMHKIAIQLQTDFTLVREHEHIVIQIKNDTDIVY